MVDTHTLSFFPLVFFFSLLRCSYQMQVAVSGDRAPGEWWSELASTVACSTICTNFCIFLTPYVDLSEVTARRCSCLKPSGLPLQAAMEFGGEQLSRACAELGAGEVIVFPKILLHKFVAQFFFHTSFVVRN